MKILMSIVRISILLIFFAFGVIAGCGTVGVQTNDTDLQPYIINFTKDMDLRKEEVRNFSVVFRTLPTEVNDKVIKKVIGRCHPLTKEIQIDPKFWYTETEFRKTSLIYHELTHCVCSQYKHDDTLKEDKCPETLMNSQSTSQKCLNKYWEEYIDELYERCF